DPMKPIGVSCRSAIASSLRLLVLDQLRGRPACTGRCMAAKAAERRTTILDEYGERNEIQEASKVSGVFGRQPCSPASWLRSKLDATPPGGEPRCPTKSRLAVTLWWCGSSLPCACRLVA